MNPFDDDQDEQVKKLIAGQMGGQMGPDAPRGTSDTDAALEDKVTDSHPGHTPESMAQWVGGQEKQVDQYGPEQQKAVIDNIIRSRDSFGSRAANAGAGFADALMQGVAQQGPGNFQKALNDRENRTEEIQGNEIPQLANLNRQGMEQKQALEGMTSTSPLGASHAAALRPILEQLYPGKTEAEYAAMLQNPQATAANLGIPAGVLESKAKLAQAEAEMAIQRGVADSNRVNQQETRKLEAQRIADQAAAQTEEARNRDEGRRHDALVELGKKSWISRVLHPGISKALETEAGLDGGNAPSGDFDAHYATLKPGDRYTGPDGKPRIKK